MSRSGHGSERIAAQESQERTTALAYVNWLVHKQGAKYDLHRATDVFPELRDKGDWEFVAQPSDGRGWLGIEVKSLVLADANARAGQWESIWNQVARTLGDELVGTFVAVGPSPGEKALHPSWPPRSQLEPLITALTEIMRSHVLGCAVNNKVDIGPSALALFPEWPKDISTLNHSGEGTQPKVVNPPCKMILIKTSDGGSEIISSGPATLFIPGMVDLDEFHKIAKKANVQLGRARQHGATRTVLLLEDHRLSSPSSVDDARASIPAADIADIDDMLIVSHAQGSVVPV